MSTSKEHRRHVSYRLPEDLCGRIDELAEALRRVRPSWIPPTCRLNDTDVVALALDRGLTLLEGSVRDEKKE